MRKNPSPGRRRPSAVSADPRPTYADLVRIVDVLRSTERFSEFRLKAGDIEIEVKRSRGAAALPVGIGAAVAPAAPAVPVAPVPTASAGSAAPVAAASAAPVASAVAADEASLPEGLQLVRAPTMGTFYRAPKPGAPAFVEPGTRVAAGDPLGLVEVMKLFNSVNAPCAGTVTHVLAGDAAVVAEGQALIALRPDA